MLKLRFFWLICTSISILPIYCMLTTQSQLKPWKHRPLIEKSNIFTTAHRTQLDQHPKLAPQLNPHIAIVREATPDEFENRCDYYALKQATGFTSSGSFYERVEIIADCFHQTKHPNPNDIAIHTMNADSLSPLHFSVVKSVTFPKKESLLSKKPKPTIVLESKWGQYPYIFEHGPFDVPECYGRACAFFTLKNEYSNQKP